MPPGIGRRTLMPSWSVRSCASWAGPLREVRPRRRRPSACRVRCGRDHPSPPVRRDGRPHRTDRCGPFGRLVHPAKPVEHVVRHHLIRRRAAARYDDQIRRYRLIDGMRDAEEKPTAFGDPGNFSCGQSNLRPRTRDSTPMGRRRGDP
jgi:hypothetical protein